MTTVHKGAVSIAQFDTPWLRRYSAAGAAGLRLFCFHFAGGGASIYRNWGPQLGELAEVIAVQLPGREWRVAEQPRIRLDQLARELADVMQPYLQGRYAFFGHSMGALVSYELLQEIHRRGWPAPVLYMPSARKPPHLPDDDPVLHGLSDAEFVAELGPESQAALQPTMADAELRGIVLPLLRADYELCETYEYGESRRLSMPIAAFGGASDSSVREADLGCWQELTTARFRYYSFHGDHFFVRSQERAVLNCVRRELSVAADVVFDSDAGRRK